MSLSLASFLSRPFWRAAFLAFASSVAASAWAASPIGQSFTVSGTGSVTLDSVTFQDVTFPYVDPGIENVVNIFAFDSVGLNGGSTGYNNATPILFTSTGFSTVGNLTTYTFTGATLVGGASYYAVFDKGGNFAVGGNTFAGGGLLFGNDFASHYDSSSDATGFAVSTSAVPEPSTYAAIFGAMALGAVAVIRRRRAAAVAQN